MLLRMLIVLESPATCSRLRASSYTSSSTSRKKILSSHEHFNVSKAALTRWKLKKKKTVSSKGISATLRWCFVPRVLTFIYALVSSSLVYNTDVGLKRVLSYILSGPKNKCFTRGCGRWCCAAGRSTLNSFFLCARLSFSRSDYVTRTCSWEKPGSLPVAAYLHLNKKKSEPSGLSNLNDSSARPYIYYNMKLADFYSIKCVKWERNSRLRLLEYKEKKKSSIYKFNRQGSHSSSFDCLGKSPFNRIVEKVRNPDDNHYNTSFI